MQEKVLAKRMRITKVSTDENKADLFTTDLGVLESCLKRWSIGLRSQD